MISLEQVTTTGLCASSSARKLETGSVTRLETWLASTAGWSPVTRNFGKLLPEHSNAGIRNYGRLLVLKSSSNPVMANQDSENTPAFRFRVFEP